MATFTDKHRDAFTEECRQKAWSGACHANWIGDQFDKLIEDFRHLSA